MTVRDGGGEVRGLTTNDGEGRVVSSTRRARCVVRMLGPPAVAHPSRPFVDSLLSDGSRLRVVIADATRQHWAVNTRNSWSGGAP